MPAADKNVRPTKTGLPDENSLHHKAGPAHEMSLLPKESLAHKRRRPCSRGEEGQRPATGRTAGVARRTARSTGRPAWQAWRHALQGADTLVRPYKALH